MKRNSDSFLFFLFPFLFFFFALRFCEHSIPSALELLAEQKIKGTIIGTAYNITETEKGNRIYLKHILFREENSKDIIHVKETILLYDSSSIEVLSGNVLRAKVTLQNFRHASNHGQYDEYQYQKSHGIDLMAYSKELFLVDKKRDKISYYLQSLKKRLREVYYNLLDEKEASIISAMVLGEKSGLDSDIKELYSINGIAHILAISGLHISMIGLIFYKIIRTLFLKIECIKNQTIMMQLTMICPAACAISFLIFYGKMTGFSISARRAIIMFFLSLLAGLVGRTYDLFTSASLALLLILMQEPLLINDSGFWLSFGAVFGIAILLPLLQELFPDIEVTACSDWKKAILYSKNKIKNSFLVSLAVFLATLPVIIKTYFSYPLYGIFLNLVIIPFMSILFPISFCMGILGLFWKQAASILVILVKGILDFYEMICLFTEQLPWSIQLTGCPQAWKIFLYYIIMAGLVLIWNKKQEINLYQNYKNKIRNYKNTEYRNNKNKKKAKRRTLFLFLTSILFLYRLPSFNLKMYFLDIGQGDSIVMELPKGKAITIDGGSSDISNVGKYRLLPFLKSKRIKEIECAFLTHMDKDHISAIEELLEMQQKQNRTCIIKYLAVSIVLKENKVWNELKELAQKSGTKILYLHAGDEFEIENVKFQCLYPMDTAREAGNATSLVLKVSYKKFHILLTGDIEKEGEASFVRNCKDDLRDINILKVGHHGSSSSSSEKFIEVCHPMISIISCGKENRYGHPHQEVLERLSRIESKIIMTKERGEIMISTNGEKMRIKCFFDEN